MYAIRIKKKAEPMIFAPIYLTAVLYLGIKKLMTMAARPTNAIMPNIV